MKSTTTRPTSTTSILSGTSSGIHPPIFMYNNSRLQTSMKILNQVTLLNGSIGLEIDGTDLGYAPTLFMKWSREVGIQKYIQIKTIYEYGMTGKYNCLMIVIEKYAPDYVVTLCKLKWM